MATLSLQAAKSKDELVAYYKKARHAMTKAAKDVRTSATLIARKDKLVASAPRPLRMGWFVLPLGMLNSTLCISMIV